jgi:DHA1 family bicyclomycin/chloramphenicol resistance-like MFS transporter
VAFVLQTGFSTGAFMAAASASPSLLKELMHRPATEFGLYFAFFPVGFFCGNFIASRIGRRVAPETMVLAGSLMLVAAVALLAALLMSGYVVPLAIFVPGFFITLAQGLALPFSQSEAIATVPRLAGTAAGVGVFMQNFCGASFSQIYGLVADGTPHPMVINAAIGAFLCMAAGMTPFLMSRARPRSVT